MHILLASASPRRRGILGGLVSGGLDFARPDIDETRRAGEGPHAYASRLSREKMADVAHGRSEDGPLLIVTADTIVALDDLVLGKPTDRDDAVASLRLLGGRTHEVITSMTLRATGLPLPPAVREMTGAETTRVTFRALDDPAIDRYLSLIEYRDKAGSYAFQEHGSLVVAGFEGSATNIIGFPLRLFFRMLGGMGLQEDVFGRG